MKITITITPTPSGTHHISLAEDGALPRILAECASADDAQRLAACWQKFDGTPTDIVEAMTAPVKDLIVRLLRTEEELDRAGETINHFMQASKNKAEWLVVGKSMHRGAAAALKKDH
jgi:hypothetical protein